MKRLNKSGFSMIELLVVLLIIGILAAVAAPMFLQNTGKAKISEAVAALGAIREGQRIYRAQYGSYLTSMGASDGKAYFGTGGSEQSRFGVLIHGNKYFSPHAFTFSNTAPSGSITSPLDFVILATGASSVGLSGTGSDAVDGARNPGDVNEFEVVMDNTGAIMYKTTSGGAWQDY